MGFVSLGIVGAFALFIPTLTQEEGQLYSNIKVKMYVLDPASGARTEETCNADDPSTPQNEADTRYGCTAFPGENSEYPYPYSTNPATVSIEDDYLLDVVPREMGTYYHPLALKAQAIVARTYAYCAMRANEGTEDYWGYCRKEINNSNEFQVFVPYYFESINSPNLSRRWSTKLQGYISSMPPNPAKALSSLSSRPMLTSRQNKGITVTSGA